MGPTTRVFRCERVTSWGWWHAPAPEAAFWCSGRRPECPAGSRGFCSEDSGLRIDPPSRGYGVTKGRAGMKCRGGTAQEGSRMAAATHILRDTERFVGVGVDDEGAGREAADVDEELRIVGAGDETGFSGNYFPGGEVSAFVPTCGTTA